MALDAGGRFWFKTVFELPILDEVKYLMRLDLDSRLTGPWKDVFGTMDKQKAMYWANKVIYDSEWVTPGAPPGAVRTRRHGWRWHPQSPHLVLTILSLHLRRTETCSPNVGMQDLERWLTMYVNAKQAW
jgi:hypothetical protein